MATSYGSIRYSGIQDAGIAGASTKTYVNKGRLRVSNGDERIYISSNSTLSQIDGFAQTAPVGDDITIRINKNGSQAILFAILDGTNSTLETSADVSLLAGDYITVDITSVGSSVPGSDLQLVLTI